MIQRIQTIYLTLTFLLIGVLPFIFPLWTLSNGKDYFFMQNQIYAILLGLSTAITIYSIISFKKRQTQFVANRLNIVLNLILLGLFVYHSLNLSGETVTVSEKGIGMFLPVLAVVFLVLAKKANNKDEDLLKYVDRLR
jgi:peptidoglycan/LPS O-acetylase OafA/YrhL